MNNIITKFPKYGDIVVAVRATKEKKCITRESFLLSNLDTTVYELEGTVYSYENSIVHFVSNAPITSMPVSTKGIVKIEGYTLDGTDREGTISFRLAASDTASTPFVINYNTTTKEGLVSIFNNFFSTNETLTSQGYKSYLDGEDVKIIFNYTFYQQLHYIEASNGFTLSKVTFDGIPASTSIRRKHGGYSGSGAISSMSRATIYFKQDRNDASFNPTSALKTIRTNYPVVLPAYLGTSIYRDGDMCEILRQTYGEGEEGWLKYFESCEAVTPTDQYALGYRDGYGMTKQLASTVDDEGNPICQPAVFCLNYETECCPKGSFYWSLPIDVKQILSNVSIIDDARTKMGVAKITDSRYLWCSLLFGTQYCWHSSGSAGCFYDNYFISSLVVLPVSLFEY